MFILLTGSFAFSKTPVCTERALQVVKAMPEFEAPECSDQTYSDETQTSELRKKTLRKRALLAYRKKLALWGTRAQFFSTSALEACEKKGSVGPLSKEEAEAYFTSDIGGNASLRLVTTADPCLPIGAHADPYDAFLLIKSLDGKIVVTQVLDGAYGNLDSPVDLIQVKDPNDQPLVLLRENESQMAPFMHESDTFIAFHINPENSQAEPAKIFPARQMGSSTVSSSTTTNELYSEIYSEEGLEGLKNGTLMAELKTNELDSQAFEERSNRLTYRWDGKAYVVVRIESEPNPVGKDIGAYRACLKANFGTAKVCEEPVEGNVTCVKQNDLAWLNFKANKLQDALKYAQLALESCKDKSLELKHADYNYKQIQKALQAKKH